MARRLRRTPFEGIYEEVDDAEDGLPPVPRANTAAEVAATTGPGLIRPRAVAQTAAPGGGRAAADPRLAYAELAQRDREAQMRYDLQQQQLRQEGQQQQQRGYLDLIRSGADIWAQDADRAQRADQFERTGEEGAYRFDVGREDDERRLQQQMEQRDYQFEQQRQDEREQAINASNQRLYEFDQQRMPSQRDMWQAQQQQQEMQRRFELEHRYKQMDMTAAEERELEQIKTRVSHLWSNPNLTPEMKQDLATQMFTKIDVLEAKRQATQAKGMEQQQMMKQREFDENEKLMGMSVPQRFHTDDKGQRWLRQPDGKLERVEDKAQEQQIKMQEAREKAMDAQRTRIETSVKTRLDAKRKVFDAAYQREDARQDRMIQGLENQIADAAKMGKNELIPELESKKGFLEADRDKNIMERMKAAGHPGSHDEFEAWAEGQYQQAMTQAQQGMAQQQQTQEPPKVGAQQTTQAPPANGRMTFYGQGDPPPGMGRSNPEPAAKDFGPPSNLAPPGQGQQQAPPPPPQSTPPQAAGQFEQDKQMLSALVSKSSDPRAKDYGEAAMMILEEHQDFDRMPPGVQATYVDLLKAIRGKRDVPARAHEGRVSGTYGRTGTGGLPTGTAPFGR